MSASITATMAWTLAHFTTTPAGLPMYVHGPSSATVKALCHRRLLDVTGPVYGRRFALSPLGVSTLGILLEAGVVTIPLGCDQLHGNGETCGDGCYQHAFQRWGMSGLQGGVATRAEFREALAWAPEQL